MVRQSVVDVYDHEVTTAQLTVLTSLLLLRDTGVQLSAMTHCIATEVSLFI